MDSGAIIVEHCKLSIIIMEAELFGKACSLVQAFVVVGDNNGHVGLGVKCAKEVSPALPSVQLCSLTTCPVMANSQRRPLRLSMSGCCVVRY